MRHLSFSNVIAVIALFIALGGAAYAGVKLKANSVGSKQVRDGSLTGDDVSEGSLAQVPSAARAADASSVGGLTPAQIARRGIAFTGLRGANQAAQPPGQFTCLHSDGVACDGYFGNFDAPGTGRAEVAFGKDDFGIVHLQGTMAFNDFAFEPVPPGKAFTLPEGMRPADDRVFMTLRNGTDPVRVDVEADGDVSVAPPYADDDWFSLDGIDFPAG